MRSNISIVLGRDNREIAAFVTRLAEEYDVYGILFPEGNTHPSTHGALADALVERAECEPIVAGTHSEVLILRLRRRVAEGLLSSRRLKFHWVEGERVVDVRVLPDGSLEGWPEGVFSESFAEVKAIRAAQRRLEESEAAK